MDVLAAIEQRREISKNMYPPERVLHRETFGQP